MFEVYQNGKHLFTGNEYDISEWLEDQFSNLLGFNPSLQPWWDEEEKDSLMVYLHSCNWNWDDEDELSEQSFRILEDTLKCNTSNDYEVYEAIKQLFNLEIY